MMVMLVEAFVVRGRRLRCGEWETSVSLPAAPRVASVPADLCFSFCVPALWHFFTTVRDSTEKAASPATMPLCLLRSDASPQVYFSTDIVLNCLTGHRDGQG